MAIIDAKKHYSGYTQVTAGQVAEFLGKTLTTQEQSIVSSIISSIEIFIASKCRRNFKYDLGTDLYEEIFDAGRNRYEFYNFPIETIEAIYIDDNKIYENGGSNNVYQLNRDFYIYGDYIVFETFTPQSAFNNKRALKIHYKIKKFWGDDVILAIKIWVSQIFSSKEYGSKTVNSFSFSGLSLSFKDEDIPFLVKEVIKTYQKKFL